MSPDVGPEAAEPLIKNQIWINLDTGWDCDWFCVTYVFPSSLISQIKWNLIKYAKLFVVSRVFASRPYMIQLFDSHLHETYDLKEKRFIFILFR